MLLALSLLIALTVALLGTSLPFPGVTDLATARERAAADGAPIVVFRPGCSYCLRLLWSLGGRARQVHWVDVRRDRDASRAVRAATGGDETVPTVLTDAGAHVNPDPSWVRSLLPGPPSTAV